MNRKSYALYPIATLPMPGCIANWRLSLSSNLNLTVFKRDLLVVRIIVRYFFGYFYSTQVKFCFQRCLTLFCFCLFVNQISREPLNGFATNSQGRRVWSLARTSLNVKVKGQKSKVKVTSDKKRSVQSHQSPSPAAVQTLETNLLQSVYRNSCTAYRLMTNLVTYSVNFNLLFWRANIFSQRIYISHTFCRSATKFGNVRGLANQNLFTEFRAGVP